MSRPSSSALPIAYVGLRILIVLNWIYGAIVLALLVGTGVSYFGSLGTPVALTSLAFLVGMLLLPLGEETKGQALPA